MIPLEPAQNAKFRIKHYLNLPAVFCQTLILRKWSTSICAVAPVQLENISVL